MLKKLNLFNAAALMLFVFGGAAAISAQTSAFTYQGRFTDTTVQQPTNGNYNMTFRLYDAATNGTQIPNNSTAVTALVTVVNGIFTTRLDFGAAAFNTTGARFLEIQVGQTFLTPRQEITAAPFANRAANAAAADSLSANCVGCVTNAQINSIAGSKVTDTVANATTATTATTAGNVTGIVAIANGGTGSATKNFVDTTTTQTVGGSKTFNNVVTANTLSAGTGGLNMNSNFLRLRDSADNNHGMLYSTTVDGPEFRAFSGFRWANGVNGATQRMSLDGSGNLTVGGNIASGGTISGTLANDSVSGAQVADGSLRLSDISILNLSGSLGPFTVNANSCVGINVNLPSAPTAIGDILYVYPSNATPAGIFIQATITTSTTVNAFYVCNALNSNIAFPAQTIRYHFVRP